MDPLFILLLGMLVVILAVLRLRLHAFLALLCGSVVVGSLTSHEGMYYREIRDRGVLVLQIDDQSRARVSGDEDLVLPSRYVCFQLDAKSQSVVRRGEVVVQRSLGTDRTASLTVGFSAPRDGAPAIQPAEGDYLVHPRDITAAEELANLSWPARIANGFGNTCGKIGILIAMAAIIGKCLLDSGAAETIVEAMRRWMGQRNTPLAFSLSGFVIGIPVYFDTVFYLLLPLARAMAQRTGRNFLLYILAIIIGASMAHSLVPPTPGPLLVAAELDVALGTMIVAGTVVGLVAVAVGFLYAVWANRRWPLPLRAIVSSAPDTGDPPNMDNATDTDGTNKNSETSRRHGPPLWLSFLPIALPVLLLSVGTAIQLDWEGLNSADPGTTVHPAAWLAATRSVWSVLGDKHVALGLATVIALAMLLRYHPTGLDPIRSVQDAILSAGSIVLITAAGGAFGHVLRQSGIADAIQQRFPVGPQDLSLLIAAFLITSVVRIAQGSATVAMITAVGIVAPLVQSIDLSYHTVYVALAIGCGSKPVPWMNDSGFWIITRMTGMTEGESLRTFSVVLTIMGLVGLCVTLAGATWLPMTAGP